MICIPLALVEVRSSPSEVNFALANAWALLKTIKVWEGPAWAPQRSLLDSDRVIVRFGSLSEVGNRIREVRSAPRNGHRRSGSACPFRANKRLMQCSNITPYSITSSAGAGKVGGTTQASKFTFVINLKTPKALGIALRYTLCKL
jgi:hypothetical protein